MASLAPETLTRLQALAFVENAELSNPGRVGLIREVAKNMAEMGLRKLLKDCIKTVGDYQGHPGSTLMLDVYVLAPHELHKIIADARNEGRKDAERWTPRSRNCNVGEYGALNAGKQNASTAPMRCVTAGLNAAG